MSTPQVEPHNNLLLLGAGELGLAFLPHLQSLSNVTVTIAVRQPVRYAHLSTSGLSFIAVNHHAQIVPSLADVFSHYDTIISCTGFGQPAGTQEKLTEAVLLAGKLREERRRGKPGETRDRLWYFPWQWGVDYDVTGSAGGLMPLFGEQLDVRNILRERAGENGVKWTIVSTGIFMSFLLSEEWRIVDNSGKEEVVVRALGNWDHKITVTDVHDIGKMVARVLTGEIEESDGRPVYIAGDTLSYRGLAELMERVTGKRLKREEWTVELLKNKVSEEPDNILWKYRLVFAQKGVWWDRESTENWKLGVEMKNVETWVRENWLD